MSKKNNPHYVPSVELEDWWDRWNNLQDQISWDGLSERIYRICGGVATKFHPNSEEEYIEHVHDAWETTMNKIKNGKLKFTKGRAPVFNLVTTTIFRILYTKMNKAKKQREHHKKYFFEFIHKNNPELLSHFDDQCIND